MHGCLRIIVLWLRLQSLHDTPSLASVPEPGYWVMSQHRSCLVLCLMGWPLPCTVSSRLLKPWDSTVSCLAVRLRVDPFHAPFSCLLRPWDSTVSCLLHRPMGWILPCTVSCLFQSLETAPFMPSSQAQGWPLSCTVFMPAQAMRQHRTADQTIIPDDWGIDGPWNWIHYGQLKWCIFK